MLWAGFARERDCYVCGGLIEVDGGRLYNAAVLVGPDGFVGRYRKAHLWDREKLFFEPGVSGSTSSPFPSGGWR